MANYYASARTNYFRVRDLDAFQEALIGADVRIIHSTDDQGEQGGRIALLSDNPDGAGWTTCAYDEESGEYREIDVAQIVCDHLADGEIAYGLEVGAEKLRYLLGMGWATNGIEVIHVDLERQVRKEIQERFDVEDMGAVSCARY